MKKESLLILGILTVAVLNCASARVVNNMLVSNQRTNKLHHPTVDLRVLDFV